MNTAAPIHRLPPNDITLFLSGDVMTGRGIDQALPHSAYPRLYESYIKDAREYVRLAEKANGPILQPLSYAYIWGDALQVWEQLAPELRIINLETCITAKGAPWPGKGIHYRMHPQNIAVLKASNTDVVSLANNHSMDWGRSGLLDSLEALQAAGIDYVGAGKNEEEARKPAIITTKQGRIVLLACSTQCCGAPRAWAAAVDQAGVWLLSGLDHENLQNIAAQVETSKKPGDIVVLSIHWGSNWGWDIPAEQQWFARQLIDKAGIDLVHGHSSHHARGIEVYRDKLILYGAGDFVNDYEGIRGYEHFRGDLSLMYFPSIEPGSGRLLALKMVPMQTRNFQLRRASADDTLWLCNVLKREGRKFGNSLSITEDGSLSLQWVF